MTTGLAEKQSRGSHIWFGLTRKLPFPNKWGCQWCFQTLPVVFGTTLLAFHQLLVYYALRKTSVCDYSTGSQIKRHKSFLTQCMQEWRELQRRCTAFIYLLNFKRGTLYKTANHTFTVLSV